MTGSVSGRFSGKIVRVTGAASGTGREVSRYGSLDVVINNAGIAHPELVEDTSNELYNRVIAVTQTSVFPAHKHSWRRPPG